MPAAKDDQTRAAFIAARLTGDTMDHAAKAAGISRTTAKRWWKEYQQSSEGSDGSDEVGPQNNAVIPAPRGDITPHTIGGQLLEFVSESLETLRSQAVHARDPAWLKQQRANDLAILYGVIADKSVRVLAAIQASADGK